MVALSEAQTTRPAFPALSDALAQHPLASSALTPLRPRFHATPEGGQLATVTGVSPEGSFVLVYAFQGGGVVEVERWIASPPDPSPGPVARFFAAISRFFGVASATAA